MGLWTDFNIEQRRLHSAANGTYPLPETDPFGGLIPRLRVKDIMSLVAYWESAMQEFDAPAEIQTDFWAAIDTAAVGLPDNLEEVGDSGTTLAHWNAFQAVSQSMDAHAARVTADELNTILRAFGESLGQLPQTLGAAAAVLGNAAATGLEAFLAGLSPLGFALVLGAIYIALERRKE